MSEPKPQPRRTMTKATLAQALVAAQKEMPAVEPDKTNPHFRSEFVSLDRLIARTRPVLNAHGLSISQWPSHLNGGEPALTTRLMHENGEAIEVTMPLLIGKNDMQGLGGAITYARRYSWASVCGIVSEEDDDGNTAAARPVQESGNATAARSAASTQERELALLQLADDYRKLVPDWDGLEATKAAIAEHRGDGDWFDRALDKMRKNVTEVEERNGLFKLMGALLDEFEGDDQVPTPHASESWNEWSQAAARAKYGVTSRSDLTTAQLKEHIQDIRDEGIPF